MIFTLAFLGPPEVFLIMGVLLLLFGAKKLPQLARGMGKSLGEFKKAREDFEDEVIKGEDEAKKDA
jgi:sec-independent protein translocase protein TatA